MKELSSYTSHDKYPPTAWRTTNGIYIDSGFQSNVTNVIKRSDGRYQRL